MLPEAVERALLVHPHAKYLKPEGEPPMIEVTTLAGAAHEFVGLMPAHIARPCTFIPGLWRPGTWRHGGAAREEGARV